MFISNLIYFTLLYLISYILSINSNLSKFAILPIVLPSIYILLKNSNNTKADFFAIIKGYFILIPMIIYPYYNNYYKSGKSTFYTYVLMLNVLVVSIILGLKSNNNLSKLNCLYLLFLSLYTPILYNVKNNNVVFNNNYLWAIGYTIILSSNNLFNEYYTNNRWKFANTYSSIIPTIHILFSKNTKLWFPLRIYSLVITIFIQLLFPSIHTNVFNKINTITSLNTTKMNIFKSGYLIIETIILLLIMKQGYKNTFLEYFLK